MLRPVEKLLDEAGVGAGPLEAEPLGDGHSNVTFLIRRGRERFVLRRPPRPPLPPSAHDVLREARILQALEGSGARVPGVIHVHEDEHPLGVPFYVMELVEGSVLNETLPPELDSPEERRRVGEELVDALVELHAVEPPPAIGRPDGYLERQLRRFADLWELTRTRELPLVGEVHRRLASSVPASGPATVVHGDFRLGNAIFAPGAPARLAALVDWELATVGDPLADLGYLTATWFEPGDEAGPMTLSPVTALPGFLSRQELVARYEERSGRRAARLGWYRGLALWKAAVFLEGNYRRWLDGGTDDPYYRRMGEGVPRLVRQALAELEAA